MNENQEKRMRYYRKFTDDRNRALEKMLNRYRVEIADTLRPCFMAMAQAFLTGHSGYILDHTIRDTGLRVQHIVMRMRHNIYAMTVASSGEIFARLMGNERHIVHHRAYDKMSDELEAGGNVAARTVYYLNKIARRLHSVQELAQIKGEKLTIEEIISALPKLRPIKKKPILQRIKEANDDDDLPDNMTTDTISNDDWDNILSDYQDDYIPVNRGPDAVHSDEEMLSGGEFPSGRYEDATYDWELENDVTHDFVQTVREGQSDAASQNGITDFVWVAVVDDRTDDCCLWRDKLTTTEIQAALEGEHSDDECDGTEPPIHFNCRCDLEPVGDDLPDVPESNQGDFEEWLSS